MAVEVFYITREPTVRVLSMKEGEDQTVTVNFENITMIPYRYKITLTLGIYNYGNNFEVLSDAEEYESGESEYATPGRIYTKQLVFTLPEDVYALPDETGGNYCFKVALSVLPVEQGKFQDTVAFSQLFDIREKSADCVMNYFIVESSPTINCHRLSGTHNFVGYTGSATDIVDVPAIFDISFGAVAKVGGVEQLSGITTQDFSSPITYRVIAENEEDYQDYLITIEESAAGTSQIRVWTSALTRVNPSTVIVGKNLESIVHIFAEVSSTNQDYSASEGQKLTVYWQKGEDQLSVASIDLDRDMQEDKYYVFEGQWRIPYEMIDYDNGDTITLRIVSEFATYADVTFEIDTYAIESFCLSFSEKLGVFQGERIMKSQFMLRLNNDLYAAYSEDWDIKNKFYLQDYYDDEGEGSLYHFDELIEWMVYFYAVNTVISVIFQSLAIEMGNLSGEGESALKPSRIDYETYQHVVSQDPFYDTRTYAVSGVLYEWENPWQPVRRDEKWYLSIKNGYNENALIKNQKLKGSWIGIILTGAEPAKMYLRSVITKIAKIFN